MIWLMIGLGLLVVVLLFALLAIAGAGGLTLWAIQSSKRPGVLIFYPGGRTKLRRLKKDEHYHGHIELSDEHLAYTISPGSLMRINDKVPIYLVYAPVGQTLKAVHMHLLQTVREAGFKDIVDFFRAWDPVALQYEDAYTKVTAAMKKAGTQNLEELEAKAKAKNNQELLKAIAVVRRYIELKPTYDAVAPYLKTLRPEEVEPLVKKVAADYTYRMVANARTEARMSMLNKIEELLRNRHTEIILGLIILAIIVVIMLLHPSSTASVAQSATHAASKVVEGNTMAGVHM